MYNTFFHYLFFQLFLSYLSFFVIKTTFSNHNIVNNHINRILVYNHFSFKIQITNVILVKTVLLNLEQNHFGIIFFLCVHNIVNYVSI